MRIAFSAMASHCEAMIDDQSATAGSLESIAERAIAEVRRIEARFSRYRADSIVSLVNAGAGGADVAIDAETGSLLDYAAAMYEDSDGRFDITSGILRRAWNFTSGIPPTQAELQALLPSIGWSRVERSATTVRLPAGMELDFGGFGKEYAFDRAAAVLAKAGIRHALVNLGGDIRCLGAQANGAAWQIAIQHPRHADALIASIPVTDMAVATSGDYERYFMHQGRRYCHVIDPRSGWPVDAWQSISVVAPVAVAAGAIATIALLNQAGALDYLESAGFAYLAVRADGQVFRRDIVA
ncbi:FAD:protein FMN transferase [soil metagenome]